MRLLLFFCLFSFVLFGQTKDEILNNLQRGGIIDMSDASPTSTYDVLAWDGDELKLVTIQVLGSTFDDVVTTDDGTIGDNLTVNGSLTLAVNLIADIDSFTTTAETDTVLITGATSADHYIVSMKYVGGVDQQDVIEWEAITGGLVVHRMAAGESGAKYSWIRIKR